MNDNINIWLKTAQLVAHIAYSHMRNKQIRFYEIPALYIATVVVFIVYADGESLQALRSRLRLTSFLVNGTPNIVSRNTSYLKLPHRKVCW